MIANVAHLSGLYLPTSCRPVISFHQSNKSQFQFSKVFHRPIQHASPNCRHIKCAVSGRNGHQGLPSHGGVDHEPFWLTMVKDVACGLRSLAIFLSEQPSQLKYIEWPTFQNTLRTATLTLILVALLIVALSSIDAALCYVLAFLLRKPA